MTGNVVTVRVDVGVLRSKLVDDAEVARRQAIRAEATASALRDFASVLRQCAEAEVLSDSLLRELVAFSTGVGRFGQWPSDLRCLAESITDRTKLFSDLLAFNSTGAAEPGS